MIDDGRSSLVFNDFLDETKAQALLRIRGLESCPDRFTADGIAGPGRPVGHIPLFDGGARVRGRS